jgi:hypothetical protein
VVSRDIISEVFILAKGEQRGNREAKKPKKEKPKINASAPSTKVLTIEKPPGGKR